jgi:dGTPase
LTHTLEVSQIARTIARSLNLNEDLTEAIALGHDLGHTPFGHMGEEVLNGICRKGFKHYIQSLRVVDKLEYGGKGLNLTDQVRDGILKHSKGSGSILPLDSAQLPGTLEGQIVRIADLIAYINHDIDDALRAKLLKHEDLPKSSAKILGRTFAGRIDTIVKDVIEQSLKKDLEYISVSKRVYEQLQVLRGFLYEKIYLRAEAESEKKRIKNVIMTIYQFLLENGDEYILSYPESDSIRIRCLDFIAGMSDNYAIKFARRIFFPKHSL